MTLVDSIALSLIETLRFDKFIDNVDHSETIKKISHCISYFDIYEYNVKNITYSLIKFIVNLNILPQHIHTIFNHPSLYDLVTMNQRIDYEAFIDIITDHINMLH